jgi:hypothetical protein
MWQSWNEDVDPLTPVLLVRRKLNVYEEPREKLLLMASHSDSLFSSCRRLQRPLIIANISLPALQ